MGWNADSRLAERIRERVANIVLFELQDPRIALVTVTRVKLAKDLSLCKVYYSVLGSEADRSKTAHALRDASGFVRRSVAKILRTRTTPKIEFVFDESVEGDIRMSGLLRELKKEWEPAENTDGGAGAPEEGRAPDDEDDDGE